MNRVPRNQLGFGFGPHALSSRSPGGSRRTREKLDLERTGAALVPPRSHRDLKTAERRAVGPISILVRHLPLYLVLKILFPSSASSPFFFRLLSLLASHYVSSSSFIFFLLIICFDKNATIKIIKIIKFNPKTLVLLWDYNNILTNSKILLLISISNYCVLKSLNAFQNSHRCLGVQTLNKRRFLHLIFQWSYN